MVQQQCTRCGFRTQATACENCGSAAIAPARTKETGPAAAGGASLLNAPVAPALFDPGAQALRENPALP